MLTLVHPTNNNQLLTAGLGSVTSFYFGLAEVTQQDFHLQII